MIVYKIHPVNPQRRHLETVARILKNQNGIAIYPTDTVYGMGASITNPKALERISRILHKDKARLFSFICSDFAQISEYAIMSNAHFKLMKHYLPGPFTFILPATNFVPKKIHPKRKTIGVRIPLYPAIQELVSMIGVPLANASINLPEAQRGDPELVLSAAQHEVETMLDAGPLPEPVGSTIVDLTGDEPLVVRPGKGKWLGEQPV
jgi:tRNA threonylcarbamoyl adenosine modification protein (Sua5/YciO/YrdC/YwlC family)